MGYELNRVMNQYGVSTPGIVNYSGTVLPVAPVALASNATDAQKTAFDILQSSYGTHKKAYDADRALFDKYKIDYQGRLQNAPMYSQSQFQTQPQAQPQSQTPLVAPTYQNYAPPVAPQATLITASNNPMGYFGSSGSSGSDGLGGLGGTGFDTTNNTSSMTSSIAGALGNVGLNSLSDAIAAANNPNYSNEGRGASSEGGGGEGIGGGDISGQSEGTPALAHGGRVKTHYQTAGAVKLPSGYESAEDEEAFAKRFFSPSNEVVVDSVNMNNPIPAMTSDLPPLTKIANSSEPTTLTAPVTPIEPVIPIEPAIAPVTPVTAVAVPKAVAPLGGERMANMQAMLAAYGPKDSAYAADLQAARTSAKAESDAFAKMLTGAMKSPEDEKSSKAEMYFRLAAAFGAPTKTGQFSENLGMVGKELGEYAKGKRASAREKLLLGLEAQKLKMASSKEDLATLRALSAEEMKDKRAIATELMKDYIKSGEPQSTAGKQALDEGLKPGTPEYQKRVEAIGNLNVEARLAQINASLAGVNAQAANLMLAQNKFENLKGQQAKLTPPELKLKTDTEETLAQTDQALANLKKAYALNPNTFDTSLVDVTQRKLLEATGSKDPKVIATRELENLLEKAALSQLKATFPGAISNDERKALQDVQGMGAKSKEERALIMKNAYTALKTVSERHRKRLNEITSGLYRDTSTPALEGGND